ncbi:uncharacterized protein [Drosophila takahashii]|uniref:uncharacterized protein isoform X2 n=1 Tax=Drosophila takahashii TaxID=29030 RepID=UPI001CF8629E|nr:uncharacterized protein LOC108063844 [Drosophila takahashii]
MTTCSVVSTPARFASCLVNFQMDELLLLKRSVMRMESLDEDSLPDEDVVFPMPETNGSESQLPERMALMAADRGEHHDTTGGSTGPWHSHPPPHPPTSWAEQKPSKLQTLFQISITALAFLSFGGYLLCLIVQAIKSKGTTYFHPVATTSTSASNGNVKRIKVYRRSRRSPDLRFILLQQDYASYMKAVREQGGWRSMLT